MMKWILCSTVVVSAFLFAGAFAALGADQPSAGPAPAATAGKIRIGVYDPRAVAVAFVRGHGQDQTLKKLQEDLRDAETAGDAARAAEIKAKGERLQSLRHLQGFAGARVDDILATLTNRLPAIARDAGVSAIVLKPDFAAENVELVDVTDRLVAEFKPDEQTLKVIKDLRAKPPVPILDVLAMKASD
jgi:hypothetical protein